MRVDIRKEMIKIEAEKLRSKLEGASLYGEPIDMDNPDEVLVAVACLTWTESYDNTEKIYSLLEMFGIKNER